MRGKLLLLHQQRLVQLTLVLLDLLLHVGDCTCNLRRKKGNNVSQKEFFWPTRGEEKKFNYEKMNVKIKVEKKSIPSFKSDIVLQMTQR